MNSTTDFTKGSISKVILKFYFPMLATAMLQQFYTFADTMIVGRGLGDNALAAVGNMSSLCFLIVGFSMGLANGFSVLIAQRFGEKNYSMLRRTLFSMVILSFGMTVLLTVLSTTFLKKTLILLQTDEIILNDSLLYGYIIFGGLLASITYNVSAGILRSLGDSRTPLTAIILSSVINIMLDCFLIFVLRTGVGGAAAATILSQVISAAVCIRKLVSIDFLKMEKEEKKFDPALSLKLLKNGVPMALMNSITAVGCMVVQYFVNGLGVAFTSAYSACSRYINLFMQPACTAGYTISAFTGQNYGAKEFDRIRGGLRVCLAIAGISYLIFGSLMFFMPVRLASILLSGDEQISYASQFLPVCGVMLFAVDMLFVYRSAVQSMGFPLVPMISGIVEMVLRIGAISILIGSLGFRATAFAEICAWTGALLLNLTAFYAIFSRERRNAVVHSTGKHHTRRYKTAC